MAAILNFRIFCKNCKTQKCLYLKNCARSSDFDNFFFCRVSVVAIKSQKKNAYISKTVLDRAILTKSLTHRYRCRVAIPIFKKKISLAKNGDHFEFSNFSLKLQNTKMIISQKPCETPISTKFLTHRVSLQSSHIFSKIVQDRAISTKFLTHRVSLQSSYLFLQILFSCQKWRPV